MILVIFPRDDETGILDGEFRDGDISQVHEDTHVPGGLDVKANLWIRVPDPPNKTKFMEELVKPQYNPPPTSGEPSPVRHKSRWRVEWRQKFTPVTEIPLVEDSNQRLPDGPTTAGGNVVNGIVEDLFTIKDLIRK